MKYLVIIEADTFAYYELVKLHTFNETQFNKFKELLTKFKTCYERWKTSSSVDDMSRFMDRVIDYVNGFNTNPIGDLTLEEISDVFEFITTYISLNDDPCTNITYIGFLGISDNDKFTELL
jgi:hypothetical protein